MLSIIQQLSELADDSIIDETTLAEFFNRSRTTIKRAVRRGELPPPIHLMGQPRWLVGSIKQHLRAAHEKVATRSAREKRRTDGLA